MFCTSCGSPAAPGLAFCTTCGARFDAATAQGSPAAEQAPTVVAPVAADPPWQQTAPAVDEPQTVVLGTVPPDEQAPWAGRGSGPPGQGGGRGKAGLVVGAVVVACALGAAGWFVPRLLDDRADELGTPSTAFGGSAQAKPSSSPAPSVSPPASDGDDDEASSDEDADSGPDFETVPAPAPPDPAPSAPAPAPAPVPARLAPVSVSATCVAEPAFDSLKRTVTYDPEHTLDGDPTTAWRCPGAALGVRLVYTFAQPVTVTSVGLVPGYDKVDPADGIDRFTENRTVSGVDWVLDDGSRFRQEIPSPTRSLTTLPIPSSSQTTTVALEIVSTGNNGARRNFTPISDVELVGY